MIEAIDWINGALATVLALAAFGALNKIRLGATRPCVALAMLLICLGAFGSAVGAAKEEWEPFIDTALFGGMGALILATQKVPSWIGERFANPLASLVAGAAAATVLASLFIGRT